MLKRSHLSKVKPSSITDDERLWQRHPHFHFLNCDYSSISHCNSDSLIAGKTSLECFPLLFGKEKQSDFTVMEMVHKMSTNSHLQIRCCKKTNDVNITFLCRKLDYATIGLPSARCSSRLTAQTKKDAAKLTTTPTTLLYTLLTLRRSWLFHFTESVS